MASLRNSRLWSFSSLAPKVTAAILVLVVPFLILLYLPALIFVYWAAGHLVEWLENRIRSETGYAAIWIFGATLGVSGFIAARMPEFISGTIAGVVCFCLLLLLHEKWRKIANLAMEEAPAGPRLTETDPLPFAGTSAWGGKAPITPEGDRVRVLSIGEFVMGGPAVCDYLLPEGSVILGGGSSTGFSPNGRYFVTPAPPRDSWSLLIYDRRRHFLYTCDVASRFWEIDLVGDMTITGRHSPLTCNVTYTAMIDDLIAQSSKQRMIKIADLKIPEHQWSVFRERLEKPFSLSADPNAAQLDWRLYLPESLSSPDEPLGPLYNPLAEIIIDQKPSGLLISMEFPLIIRSCDSQSLVCGGRQKNIDDKDCYWLWSGQEGWKPVPDDGDLRGRTPQFDRLKLGHLDRHALTVEWALLQPALSDEASGFLQSYMSEPLQIAGKQFASLVIRQIIPLKEHDGSQRLESAVLHNGEVLIWHLQRFYQEIFRNVYTLEFRGRKLEDEWLLDHCITTDSRYVALIAYSPPPFAPHRLAMLDSVTGLLQRLDGWFLDPRLQGLTDRTMHLIHVADRNDEVIPKKPLRAFLRQTGGSRLLYKRTSFTWR